MWRGGGALSETRRTTARPQVLQVRMYQSEKGSEHEVENWVFAYFSNAAQTHDCPKGACACAGILTSTGVVY